MPLDELSRFDISEQEVKGPAFNPFTQMTSFSAPSDSVSAMRTQAVHAVHMLWAT